VLHLARKVSGATLRATDGDIGTLEDFYFEEDRWTVRYLLVDTGKWFSGKKVLISPMSVTGDWGMSGVRVNLTKDQVWHSPEFDHRQPLSRAGETKILGYYGYPYYWGAGNIWGAFDNPAALATGPAVTRPADDGASATTGIDPEARDLRSTNKSTGYHLHATDGEIGHVDDFLIGQESWRIRYLLVDTSNWIGGKSVIVSCDALERLDRDRGTLHVATTRSAIRNGPAFDTIEAALDTAETGPPFTII
jgi:uncharacterized protein YrrD